MKNPDLYYYEDTLTAYATSSHISSKILFKNALNVVHSKLLRKPINGSYRLDDKLLRIYRGHIFDTENINTVIIF